MSTPYSSPAAPYLRIISRILNVIIFIIPLLVLTGWIIHSGRLTRLIPDSVAVNPLTAICFLLCAYSLWLVQDETPDEKNLKRSRWLSVTITIIGAAKLLSVLFGFDIYIDTILFNGQLFDPVRNDLNRMAPNTAICFLLGGLSLLWLDKDIFHDRRPAQYFSIVIMFVAILSLYGYVYGVKFLYGIAHYIPMSVITAFCFLLLSLALLFARPEKGSMAIIIGDTSAEVTLLRLAAFIVPLFMGWLKLKGEQSGYYNTEFGTAMFAIGTYAIALFLLGRRSVVNYRMRLVKKKASDELKTAHDNFLRFFDLSPEPKAITNLDDGRYLYINKAYENFFGIRSKDAIGKSAADLELISAEQQGALESRIRSTGMMRGQEVKLRSGNGEFRDTYLSAAVLDLADRKCVLSSLVDITERKKAEEELRQQERLLRSIVDNIGEGLIVMNTEGKYLIMNRIAEDIIRERPSDAPVGELSARFGLFYPDQVTPFPSDQTTVARSLRGLETNELELFIRNSNLPEGKFLVSTGRPIRDENGKVIAAVTVFRDDTRKRQLQKLLTETEQKLKEVIHSIGEGIVMCDRDGRFILFNKKAEEIIGQGAHAISPDQWPEKYQIYHPFGDRLFRVDELLLMRALKGETVENQEILIRNREKGIRKNLVVSAKPVRNEQNEIIAAIADFRDISEVRKLEELLTEIRDKYRQLSSE